MSRATRLTSFFARAVPTPFDPAVTFAAAFALFLFGAAPTRTLMDGGEIASAAHDLGVAHPTGFPLYLLLAKALTLLPVGEIAFRVTLFSALGGALAAALASHLGRVLSGTRAAGWLAAGLTVLGTTAYTQSTVVEVYAPTLAITFALLALGARVAAAPNVRVVWLLAFVMGLSFGLHATARVAAVAMGLSLLLSAPFRAVLWSRLGTSSAVFLLGLAILLYLPLASNRAPACDWGAPRDFAHFWDHLSAARIRRAFAGEMGVLDGERLLHHLGLYAQQLLEVVSAPGLALLGLGAFVATRAGPAGVAALLILAADAAFAVLLNPMGLPDRQTGMPGHGAAALVCALALAALGRWRPPWTRVLALGAGAALLVHAGLQGIDEKTRAQDHAAGELVDATLAELPTGALLMTRSDDLSAGVLFARVVEGARPDLLHIVRQHVWDTPTLRKGAAALVDDALVAGTRDARIARQEDTQRALVRRAHQAGRTVAWEPAEDDEAAGVPVLVAGLSAEAVRVGELPRLHTDRHPKLGALLRTSEPLSWETRRYASGLWDRAARALLGVPGGAKRAESALREALRLDPSSAKAWNNLGVFFMSTGRATEAVTAATLAVQHGPLDVAHHANLGLFLLQTSDDARAARVYSRAARLAPNDPRPEVGLGILAARAGRHDEAHRRLRRALTLGAQGQTRSDALENLQKLQSIQKR